MSWCSSIDCWSSTSCEVEVARQQRRLADDLRGEGDGAQGAGALRRGPQRPAQLDDLGVRGRAVEHELGGAEIPVEQCGGDLGQVAGAPQLDVETVEPLAALVGEQSLEGDELEHLPALVALEDADACFLGDLPGRVVISREVRDVAADQEDLGVRRAAVELEPVECRSRRLEIAAHRRGSGEARPDDAAVVAAARLQRFSVGGGGRRVTDGHQQIGAQDQQPCPIVAGGVGAHGLDEIEGVAVGAEGGARSRRPATSRGRR